MAAAKKKVDPLKAREKRMKMIAIAGSVLLLVVGAIEVPSIMKQMKGAAPPPAAPAATSALPNVSGSAAGAGVVAQVSPDGFAESDTPPAPAAGQLVSFNLFPTKNPFTPPPSVGTGSTATAGGTSSGATTTTPATAATPTAATPATATPTATTPTASGGGSIVPAGGSTSTSPTTSTGTSTGSSGTGTSTGTTSAPTGPTATISVNGVSSRVGVEGTFPTGAPVFRLISIGSGSVQIGIVGGSLDSGDAALTLEAGKTVTLANANDGKQYRLVLISS